MARPPVSRLMLCGARTRSGGRCDIGFGHMGSHRPNSRARNRAISKLYRLKKNRYWYVREKRWLKQGIQFAGAPLTQRVYEAVRILQNHRCGICGRDLNIVAGHRWAEAADHDHYTQEFRGVVCGGLGTSCNVAILGRYERGQKARLSLIAQQACASYLADPPAKRLARLPPATRVARG